MQITATPFNRKRKAPDSKTKEKDLHARVNGNLEIDFAPESLTYYGGPGPVQGPAVGNSQWYRSRPVFRFEA